MDTYFDKMLSERFALTMKEINLQRRDAPFVSLNLLFM